MCQNAGLDDYLYDENGNLTSDKNKKISSIQYNHLNLPEIITIKQDDGTTDKGTITYSYDAGGVKLKKTVLDKTITPNKTTITLYSGGAVYENDVLQFLGHEEGRIRFVPVEGATPHKFEYDYMLKDHLGNVRMVLTEEVKSDPYPALSYEGAVGSTAIQNQDAVWENKTGASINVNSVRTTRPGGFGSSGSNGSYVQLVRKSTGSIGAAKLLKVMTGDRIHASVDYYYTAPNANNTGADGLGSLVANFVSVLSGNSVVSGIIKSGAPNITTAIQNNAALGSLLNTPHNVSGANNAPKAYLNIIFFDEQFKYDGTSSMVVPVAYTPNIKATISKMANNAVTAKKSGYVYVYISNETNELVYFDNLMLTHERGRVLEETHYYPFGLTMAGISSKALNGVADNKYKWNKGSELQNKEFSDGSGLELYATNFISLDPQLGRWWQIDPKPDYGQSPYSSMSNNPIRFNDPLGDTVRVDNSITGNKLLNSSFNAYARTKEGRKFLANYAAKGQTIGGHTFKKDGKYSKQGVDLNYNAQSFDKDKGGETSKSVDASGRGQITVSVNSNFYEKTVNGLVGEAVGKIGTFFHESFIHADLHTKDFLDNKKFDYSNISSSVKNAVGDSRHYHHYKVLQEFVNKGYNSGNLWPLNAFNGMKEINDALKVYKSDQEMLNEMWNYNGGIELDEAANKKQ